MKVEAPEYFSLISDNCVKCCFNKHIEEDRFKIVIQSLEYPPHEIKDWTDNILLPLLVILLHFVLFISGTHILISSALNLHYNNDFITSICIPTMTGLRLLFLLPLYIEKLFTISFHFDIIHSFALYLFS